LELAGHNTMNVVVNTHIITLTLSVLFEVVWSDVVDVSEVGNEKDGSFAPVGTVRGTADVICGKGFTTYRTSKIRLPPFSKVRDHHRQNSRRVVCNGLSSIKQNLCILSALISKIAF